MIVTTAVSLSMYFFKKAKQDNWDVTTDGVVLSIFGILIASVFWPITAVVVLITMPAKYITQMINKGKR